MTENNFPNKTVEYIYNNWLAGIEADFDHYDQTINDIQKALDDIYERLERDNNLHYPGQPHAEIPTQTLNNTPLPTRATPDSAGADLTAALNQIKERINK